MSTLRKNTIQRRNNRSLIAFITFYYIIVVALHILAIPIIFILSFKKKYKQSLYKRFFIPSFPKIDRQTFWFHACSFGEIRALKSIIKNIPITKNEQILITTTTQTGFKEANKLFPDACICYLPFETFIPLFLKNINLQSLILFEAELWLMPLFYSKKGGANTFLLNARISTKSYKKYLNFRFFYKFLFQYVDMIFAQQDTDKERLEELGGNNIRVIGNIKLSEIPETNNIYTKPKQPIWVIASTHEKNGIKEEELILDSILNSITISNNSPRIVFAPRHPERFREVENLIQNKLNKYNLNIKSASSIGIENAIQEQFSIIDCLGELNNIYSISSLVILGGSFIDKIGGHNPIEPAYFGNKIISGPYIFNQLALFSSLQNYTICDISDLSDVLKHESLLKPATIINKIKIKKIINIIHKRENYE